ncbi:MAG: hypothetical protein GY811_06350 [Myxococcales bacterium]|nr:hypothetical protein [Myxococcales bacterium]
MNLPLENHVDGELREAVALVENERAPNWERKAGAFRKYVFQTSLSGQSPTALEPEVMARYHRIAAKQWRRVRRGSYSVSYRTKFQGKPVLHQVTAGVIDIPFETFRTNWYIPSEWGHSLADYLGGSLVIDRKDPRGRTLLQRERMVLGTPWYAIGAPDLDMSKYELVDYKANQVQVSWQVSASANRSVLVDVGYLRLCRYVYEGREQTLVLFNSVHRIDPGWLGGLTPGLVEDNLRQAFRDHIANYRKIAARIMRRLSVDGTATS